MILVKSKSVFLRLLAMIFIFGALPVHADRAFENLTGFGDDEENLNIPNFRYDPDDEQGWDVYEDPFGDLISRETPYYQNATSDIKPGEVFIKAWEYDPPGSIILRVVDQRPLLLSASEIDVRVEAGYYDAMKNLMVETRRIYHDIAIKPGENYLNVNFPVDRSHIVHARVIAVRNKGPIKLLD